MVGFILRTERPLVLPAMLRPSMVHCRKGRTRDSLRLITNLAALSLLCLAATAGAQCGGIASTPSAAEDCALHAVPADRAAQIDPAHPYPLAELIDIAENNNPRTHIIWERAKQAAERLAGGRSYVVDAGMYHRSHNTGI